MSSAPEPRDPSDPDSKQPADPTLYPTDHLVAVLDTQDQLSAAMAALTGGGFLESEIQYGTGAESADELAASTGRTGLASLLIRLAEHLGLTDEEMETKDRYERAMRDDAYVLSVAAPTEERKARALELLRNVGGHSITYFGTNTIEHIVPPKRG